MKPFITSSPGDLRVLYENFGVSFHYTQMLEDELKLILVVAEHQGLARFDRKKDLRMKGGDDNLVDACLGPLKKVLKTNLPPKDGDEFYIALDEANKARNLLAHRFFIVHAVDLLSEAGLAAINQHLSKLYLTIRHAHTMSRTIREHLFAKVGFSPEDARRELDELKRIIDEPLSDDDEAA